MIFLSKGAYKVEPHNSPIKVINNSGRSLNKGDLVYVSFTSTYGLAALTTTTASDSRKFAVVLYGGNVGDFCWVTCAGNVKVNYTGTPPVIGDYLVSSTVAGRCLVSAAPTYNTNKFHPNLFGIAIKPASGDSVDCLLLPTRIYYDASSSNDLVRINSHTGTKFNGTISSVSSANVVWNVGPTGNADSIVPASTSELCKLVCHNTTENNTGLISSVNTGTRTITLTANAPGSWSASDAIQVNSRINTDVIGASSNTFYDVEVADTATIPALATNLWLYITVSDTGGSNSTLRHSYSTGAAGKRAGTVSPAANVSATCVIPVALIGRRFQIECTATGSGTATLVYRLAGYTLASP